jgi:trehalose 6-phosphate synthase/phosphatase
MESVTADWKEIIQPVLELYRDRTPGSTITVNEYSLVWHYERAQPELAALRLAELKDAVLSLTTNLDLSILEGNKLLEIKNSNVSKGRAAAQWYNRHEWDFVAAIGDDWTDEDIFRMLGEEHYSIKVGLDVSSANYFLESVEQVRTFIRELAPE